MRSLDDHQGEPRQPAQRRPGRAPARRRQPAVRQDVRSDRRAGLRQLRLRALGDRLDGRSERRVGRRRRGVLQDLLRAEQRRARASSATSTPKTTLAKVREVLRRDSRAAGAAAGRHDRAGADRRAAADARGRARAAAAPRHGVQDSAELVARRRRAVGARRRSSRAAAARASTKHRPAEAAVDRRRCRHRRSRGPGPVHDHRRPRCRARRWRISKRRSTQEIERVKTGADRRLGDREGAHQRAAIVRRRPRQLAAAARFSCRRTRCSTTIRTGSTRARIASPR